MSKIRRRTCIKEIYNEVGLNEYDRINPYEELIAHIRCDHPSAKILHARTYSEDYGGILVPMLTIKYAI